MKSVHTIFWILFLPIFVLGQDYNTFHIRKKEKAVNTQGFSIKKYYPDSSEIVHTKILSFEIITEKTRSDPTIEEIEGELIPDKYKVDDEWSPSENEGGLLTFRNIQVEQEDGSYETLRNFHVSGELKRAKFPVYRRLRDFYPDPNIMRNLEVFLSYQLTVFGEDYHWSAILTEDRFMIDFFRRPGLKLKFHNILMLTKDGIELKVDPFVMDSRYFGAIKSRNTSKSEFKFME